MGRHQKKSLAIRVFMLLLVLWAAGAFLAFVQLMGSYPAASDAETWLAEAEVATDALLKPSLLALALVLLLWAAGTVLFRTRAKRKIKRLSRGSKALTPEQFLHLRNGSGTRGRSDVLAHDFVGIYIFTNTDDGRCYVGQAHNVISRVNQHLTGKGNGDVYADYVHGAYFEIRMIALKGSGYHTLDDLERDAIAATGAYEEGYNKTRGNRPS